MATIEHNLGIKVDHYVIFDQRSAEKLIDAMGGVTIDNPREFGQDDYSDDDVHVVPQYFAEGKHRPRRLRGRGVRPHPRGLDGLRPHRTAAARRRRR